MNSYLNKNNLFSWKNLVHNKEKAHTHAKKKQEKTQIRFSTDVINNNRDDAHFHIFILQLIHIGYAFNL